MLVKTKALVLHCLPYSDSASIVHLYTEEFGRMSYLVRLPKSRKAVLKRAFFQPLSVLEIEADHKGSRQLQYIKEAHCLYPFTGICSDVGKSTIALFLAEVLYRSLRDTEKNPVLFAFLCQSVQLLDLCDKGLANFHLVFLIKLTRYIGFYPNMESQRSDWYFDLQGGVFVASRPAHNAWLSPEEAAFFARLMDINFENMSTYQFGHHKRTDILHQMLDYYKIHLVDFPAIKSLEVLEEVFE
ncbi:MAG: DNA repair protein RecO [Bacteroidota bacterium]|nr:DNA repair protein RecO [Bacteroidota bacterium]